MPYVRAYPGEVEELRARVAELETENARLRKNSPEIRIVNGEVVPN